MLPGGNALPVRGSKVPAGITVPGGNTLPVRGSTITVFGTLLVPSIKPDVTTASPFRMRLESPTALLPVTVPVALWSMPEDPTRIPAWSWIGFAYVTLMSQYLGFFAWNAGLAIGGIAHVSQVQLLQTFVTLLIASVLNREPIALSAWFVAAAVFVLVIAAGRAKVRRDKA